MNISPNVTAAIGNTPLVQINRLITNATVLAKLEAANPAGSVKDRIAVAIVDAAIDAGALKPAGTIVEATSGNTGVGLAMVGAARDYNVVITMPESMSQERRALMQIFGAELILTPASEGMAGAVKAAEEIVNTRENAILANQFANIANPKAHRAKTAAEIWEQTQGQIDIFVAGIGTGGTISGVGAALKELNPKIRVYGIEPTESPLLTEDKAGPHKIQGIGANFIPENLDRTILDGVIKVPSDLAIETARKAASEEGLLVGISSGAALAGAKLLAEREENTGARIVTVLPDTGERYLSTALFAL